MKLTKSEHFEFRLIPEETKHKPITTHSYVIHIIFFILSSRLEIMQIIIII